MWGRCKRNRFEYARAVRRPQGRDQTKTGPRATTHANSNLNSRSAEKRLSPCLHFSSSTDLRICISNRLTYFSLISLFSLTTRSSPSNRFSYQASQLTVFWVRHFVSWRRYHRIQMKPKRVTLHHIVFSVLELQLFRFYITLKKGR